jgi:hypothetical protein
MSAVQIVDICPTNNADEQSKANKHARSGDITAAIGKASFRPLSALRLAKFEDRS